MVKTSAASFANIRLPLRTKKVEIVFVSMLKGFMGALERLLRRAASGCEYYSQIDRFEMARV
jgi:hypothetical protein